VVTSKAPTTTATATATATTTTTTKKKATKKTAAAAKKKAAATTSVITAAAAAAAIAKYEDTTLIPKDGIRVGSLNEFAGSYGRVRCTYTTENCYNFVSLYEFYAFCCLSISTFISH
jgi:hypothetical protein